MQITIDNNIIPKIRGLDESVKIRLKQLIKKKEIILHVNEIHLLELFKLRRKNFGIFKSHCETILELVNGEILEAFGLLIKDELEGNHVNRFCSTQTKEKIFKMLDCIVGSASLPQQLDEHIEKSLKPLETYNRNFISGERANLKENFRDLKEAIEEGRITKNQLDAFKEKGFEYFYGFLTAEKYARARNFCKVNNILVRDEQLSISIDNENFPFINTFLRSRSAMHYRYVCKNQREFDENDIVDNRYLINSIKFDYLISDDKGLINIASIACPKYLKVISFAEFCKLISN